MAELRHSVRAYAYEGLSPAQVAVRIDRFFQGEFATFLYVVYDPRAGVLRFANAGHLPPIIVSPEGEARFLAEQLSTPLGVGEDARFEEGEVDFPPGSAVLAYTDGLIERRDIGIDEQLRHLVGAVAGCEYGAESLCDCALAAFPPDGSDDVALLAFQATAAQRECFTVPPHPSALSGARQRLRTWLESVEADATAVENMVLATGEAVTNVIAHSGSERGARVDVRHGNGEICVTVRDFGHWDEGEPDPDHGRGLMLIEAFTDRFEVEVTDTGTTVTMISRIVRAAPQSAAAEVPLAHSA
jgi:anti-sigma regulatory factor (Ser/Thr protein kinase)